VWPPAAVGAVVLFVIGMVLMLAAVLLAVLELRRALDPVELETQFVAGLTEGFGSRSAAAVGMVVEKNGNGE